MNNQINTAVAIAVIIIIAGIVGGTIWLSGKKQDQQINQVATQQVKKDVPANATSAAIEDNKPSVEIANLKTYQNKDYGFEFQYPQSWRKSEMGDFFLRNPEINVLQLNFEKVTSATTADSFVNNFIKQHDCKNVDDPSTGDHVIEKTNSGIYFAEFCSAGTEVYHYVTKLNSSLVLDFAYQENFEDNWTVAKKIEIFKQIISTLKIKK
jgi:hypothetical protein